MAIFEGLNTLGGEPLDATELDGRAVLVGETGDVQWNFEKFLISPDGQPVARFRPTIEPESDELTMAIEAQLPA
jgi:glutathione peroxidase